MKMPWLDDDAVPSPEADRFVDLVFEHEPHSASVHNEPSPDAVGDPLSHQQSAGTVSWVNMSVVRGQNLLGLRAGRSGVAPPADDSCEDCCI